MAASWPVGIAVVTAPSMSSASGSIGGNWAPPASAGLGCAGAGPFIGWAVPKLGRPEPPLVPLRRPKALIWSLYPALVTSGIPGSQGE